MTTLEREEHSDPLDAIRPAVDLNDILVLQQQARAVGVVCPLKEYIVDVAAATRAHPDM